MNDSKFSHFLTGALVGIGLGLLLAPDEGNETRQKLKGSLNELLESVKEIDIEESKATFMKKLRSIKDDLNDLTSDAKVKVVKERLKHIKTTCEELAVVANDTSSYKVAHAATVAGEKASNLLAELNTPKKPSEEKKKEIPKKTPQNKTKPPKETKTTEQQGVTKNTKKKKRTRNRNNKNKTSNSNK